MRHEFITASRIPVTETLRVMKEQRAEALETTSSSDGEKLLQEERPVSKTGLAATKAEVPALIKDLKEKVAEQAVVNSEAAQQRRRPHGEALIDSSDSHTTARAKITQAFQETNKSARKISGDG